MAYGNDIWSIMVLKKKVRLMNVYELAWKPHNSWIPKVSIKTPISWKTILARVTRRA